VLPEQLQPLCELLPELVPAWWRFIGRDDRTCGEDGVEVAETYPILEMQHHCLAFWIAAHAFAGTESPIGYRIRIP
jgi:hypothetical protein